MDYDDARSGELMDLLYFEDNANLPNVTNIKTLLQQGADPNFTNPDGATPFVSCQSCVAH